MVIPFALRQETLPGMPEPVMLTIDVARVQRDMATLRDEIRFAIAQQSDLTDKVALWMWLKDDEDEAAHLTDLAAARVEKALEEM